MARSGRPGLGREAVQQRLHSSAAQPQQAMKEAAAAVLVRQDVDRPAWAGSASSKSGSLELLQTLDALVGAAILRRTNEGSRAGRARCALQQPSRWGHAHTLRPCPRQGRDVIRSTAGPASPPSRPSILWAVPRKAPSAVHVERREIDSRTTVHGPSFFTAEKKLGWPWACT